jgi:hypothetical protein
MWQDVQWTLWGLQALLDAGVHVVVWPRSHSDGSARCRPTWRHFVLRWFHALVWALLALSCFVQAGLLPGGWRAANVAVLLALAAYAAFLVALAIGGRSGRYGSCRGHRNV